MTQENTYDPAGNRTVQVVNGVPATWTYDNDYRLIGQNTANGVATLSYDSVFNTTVMWNQGSAPITMTADAASRLLTSNLGGVITSYVYDGAGNMVSETTGSAATTYSYDGENRLLLISYATGGPTTMTYQGWDGLRRSLQSYTYGPTAHSDESDQDSTRKRSGFRLKAIRFPLQSVQDSKVRPRVSSVAIPELTQSCEMPMFVRFQMPWITARISSMRSMDSRISSPRSLSCHSSERSSQ